ncbi:MAG: GNAT family N-acetyltransferase [Desulfovibrionaceae bacterium]|nr:GNAT family N-acetyltransferase [Desulfovibrionaceae bacterium]
MSGNVILEPLDVNNWLKICALSVSKKQKRYFTVPNVYWIGISRYEEKSELFAVKAGDVYVGLVGGGYDEDGVTGYINPIMIDKKYQGKGYGRQAMLLMIAYLRENLHVTKINIGHRKVNVAAARLYESLGFRIIKDRGNAYYRQLDLSDERSSL